jgi:hypothetical protein
MRNAEVAERLGVTEHREDAPEQRLPEARVRDRVGLALYAVRGPDQPQRRARVVSPRRD